MKFLKKILAKTYMFNLFIFKLPLRVALSILFGVGYHIFGNSWRLKTLAFRWELDWKFRLNTVAKVFLLNKKYGNISYDPTKNRVCVPELVCCISIDLLPLTAEESRSLIWTDAWCMFLPFHAKCVCSEVQYHYMLASSYHRKMSKSCVPMSIVCNCPAMRCWGSGNDLS